MPLDVETELLDQRERIGKLEICVAGLTATLAKIEGSTSVTEMLVKWVILPMIVILGGLVGTKLVFPGS